MAALALRSKLDIYGSDYPTPDGTCIRDHIHVTDPVRWHSDALRYLRAGGASVTLNSGHGHGFSVREVVEMVKRVSGVDFKVEIAQRRPAIQHRSSRDQSTGVRSIIANPSLRAALARRSSTVTISRDDASPFHD